MKNPKGCWYCGKEGEEDMAFSWEFDTFVHYRCADKAYRANPEELETYIIADEIGVLIDD